MEVTTLGRCSHCVRFSSFFLSFFLSFLICCERSFLRGLLRTCNVCVCCPIRAMLNFLNSKKQCPMFLQTRPRSLSVPVTDHGSIHAQSFTVSPVIVQFRHVGQQPSYLQLITSRIDAFVERSQSPILSRGGHPK